VENAHVVAGVRELNMRFRPYIARFDTNTAIWLARTAVPRRHAPAKCAMSPGPKVIEHPNDGLRRR